MFRGGFGKVRLTASRRRARFGAFSISVAFQKAHACGVRLYVQTTEADAAMVELAQMGRREGWRFVTWDFCHGLGSNGFEIDSLLAPTIGDPVAALMAVPKLGSQPGTTLLALRGFHRFLDRPDMVLTLERQLTAARGLRLVLIILAPVVSLPVELERQLVVIEHGLPARAELVQILR